MAVGCVRRTYKRADRLSIKLEAPSDDTDARERPAKSQQKTQKSKNDSDDNHAQSKTKSRSKRRVWKCLGCLAEFPRRKDMLEHSKSHQSKEEQEAQLYKYDKEQEVYTCNTCSAEFQEKDEVEAHFTKNHIEQYTCQDCQKKFTDAYSFSCHMQQHSDDQLYRCPLCSYDTPRMASVMTHINRMHHHKFYYYCKTCGKGFNDPVVFKEHDNEHLGLRPFVCVVCHKTFVFSRYLLLHQTRFHTVGIEGKLHSKQCSVCMRVFAKTETLVRHLNTKHVTASDAPRERKHLCDVCGKGFAQKSKLAIHHRVHTGVKPYGCNYCDKSFIKRDYLIMHERVHTGEKPYSCQYCGKCFNQAAPLRIHVRGHTGERPYICQFCNTGFISKGALNTHQKVCTGSTD